MSDAFPVQSQAIADLIEALSDKQRAAFESLRGGSSFAIAAERAGVGRVTVYRWVKADPNFRAAYNAWRQEMAESAQTRLLKLADKAVDCVEEALKCNDYGVAVTVLSKLGVMRKTRRGSIEPEVIQLQMQLQQQREKYRAAVGVMRLLLEKAGLSPEQQIDFIRQHGVDASGLPGPGHEPIPQLQDDEGEPYDEDEAADEALENQEEEQVEENAPDEAAADERGASSYPIGTMAAAPTEQMLHMPPAPQPNEPDPVSQAG